MKFISALVLLAAGFWPVSSMAVEVIKGLVVVREGECVQFDVMVIATEQGYVVAEKITGSFNREDQVVGQLNEYGFRDVLVSGNFGRLYVIEYMQSLNQAASKCFKDGLRPSRDGKPG